MAAAGPVSRSRSTRFRPPPRFSRLRSRAWLTSIRRIASAAAAKKCASAVEVLVADQPQVGLVHQGGGVEGVPGLLRGHPRGRELPQLVVDEREQVGRRLAVAGRGGVEEVGDLGHDDRVYRRPRNVRTAAPPPASRWTLTRLKQRSEIGPDRVLRASLRRLPVAVTGNIVDGMMKRREATGLRSSIAMTEARHAYRNLRTGEVVPARRVRGSDERGLLQPDVPEVASHSDWMPGIIGPDGKFHPADHSVFVLDFPPGTTAELDHLIKDVGGDPTELFKRVIALYKLAKDAAQQGKAVGVATSPDSLETQFVGI